MYTTYVSAYGSLYQYTVVALGSGGAPFVNVHSATENTEAEPVRQSSKDAVTSSDQESRGELLYDRTGNTG